MFSLFHFTVDILHLLLLLALFSLILYIFKLKKEYRFWVQKASANHSLSNLEQVESFKAQHNTLLTLYKPFQLSGFLHAITNRVASSLKLYHHQLYYDIDSSISRYIISDHTYLDTILGTLITQISKLNQFSSIVVKIEKKNKEMFFTIRDSNLILKQNELKILKEAKEDSTSPLFKANLFAQALSSTITINSHKKHGTEFVFTIPYIEDKNRKRDIETIKEKLFSKKILFISDNSIERTIIHSMLQNCHAKIEDMSFEKFMKHKPRFDAYNMIILKSKNLTSSHIKFFKEHQNNQLIITVLHDMFETTAQKKISEYIANITLSHPLIIGDLEEKLYRYFMLQSHTKEKKEHLYLNKLDEFIIKDKSSISKKELEKFKGNRIVVVEHNSIDQKIMKHLLTIQGLHVYFCFNGQELLDFLKTKEVDLIFTNIYMPFLDGMSATKEIKKILEYSHIPIIAIDTNYFEQDMVEMMKVGINGYIEKPLTSEICYSALEKFLQIKKSAIIYKTEKTLPQETISPKIYIENLSILNVTKGIKESINEEFYKELLINTMDALEDSKKQLTQYYSRNQMSQMQTFLLNILSLYQNIYAPTIITTIEEILYLITYHRESEIKQYIELYTKDWKILEDEVNNYLYSISLK